MLRTAGGGSIDPEINLTLATVLKRLKAQGVPKENVENALKRATGGKDKGDQQPVYEALAPGSVGLIMCVHTLQFSAAWSECPISECQTDNVNRTMKEVRNVLSDNGYVMLIYCFHTGINIRVGHVWLQSNSCLLDTGS